MQARSTSFRPSLQLGESFIKLRMRKGYSQQVVAQLIGVSQSTYSRLESDLQKPTLDQLQHLAELYQLSVERLIAGNIESRPISVPSTLPAAMLTEYAFGTIDEIVQSYQEALAACQKLNEVLEAENKQLRTRLHNLAGKAYFPGQTP